MVSGPLRRVRRARPVRGPRGAARWRLYLECREDHVEERPYRPSRARCLVCGLVEAIRQGARIKL